MTVCDWCGNAASGRPCPTCDASGIVFEETVPVRVRVCPTCDGQKVVASVPGPVERDSPSGVPNTSSDPTHEDDARSRTSPPDTDRAVALVRKAPPADARFNATSLTRSGREAGVWVYIDAETYRDALLLSGIDPRTDPRELMAVRYALRGQRRAARVLLRIVPRPTTEAA